MHATIRTYADAPGFIELLTANRDDIEALFRAIPGFQGYSVVRTGDGACVSLTVFADAAGSAAGTEAARGWVAEHATHLGTPTPHVAAGEVAFTI